MVYCDNPTCPIGWFHFSCVGLQFPPTGTGTVLNVMEHCNVHVYVHNCNHMTACMHACLQCTQLYQFT